MKIIFMLYAQQIYYVNRGSSRSLNYLLHPSFLKEFSRRLLDVLLYLVQDFFEIIFSKIPLRHFLQVLKNSQYQFVLDLGKEVSNTSSRRLCKIIKVVTFSSWGSYIFKMSWQCYILWILYILMVKLFKTLWQNLQLKFKKIIRLKQL